MVFHSSAMLCPRRQGGWEERRSDTGKEADRLTGVLALDLGSQAHTSSHKLALDLGSASSDCLEQAHELRLD